MDPGAKFVLYVRDTSASTTLQMAVDVRILSHELLALCHARLLDAEHVFIAEADAAPATREACKLKKARLTGEIAEVRNHLYQSVQSFERWT